MLFKPQYTITDKILNNISRITAAREIIEYSRLIPKWELKLRKEAWVHSAHSSTRIEGNQLTLKEVEAISEHKKIVAPEKDRQEVINYLSALDKIPRYAKEKDITLDIFLNIHCTLMQGVLKSPLECGGLRTKQVFVGKRIFEGTQLKEVVEYMPPDTKDVPGLVKTFLNWLNSQDVKDVNPVILAGITHYEVARIHPFIDGNGRTARLMASLILYKSGFDHRRFFALDDYYDEDRNSYYAALKTAQSSKGDITQWMEYFTGGVLHSVNKVKEIILKLGFSQKAKEAEQIELTQRQLAILDKIRQNSKITNKELRAMFKVSRQAILKEIKKLINADIITLIGKGRNAYYRIKN